MQIRLKQAAFLAGCRHSAGAVLDDYKGPPADWMEVVAQSVEDTKAAPKRRRVRAD